MNTLSVLSDNITDNITSDNHQEQLFSLQDLEQTISKSKQAFFEIGKALKIIRDQRLYRSHYSDFHNYCLERWEMSRRQADYLINAADTIENLENKCSQLPTNEAQVRALTNLSPEEQIKVWEEVVKSAPNGKITAELVKKTVKNHLQKDAPIQEKIAVTKEAKKIYQALHTLSELTVGTIREVIFSASGEKLEMPKMAEEVIEKFNHLEINSEV